ncbi:MAG: hypothetical protein EPN26_01205 [Rhodospirillales bacterium]|nr:MAG: hypothetical protein EPN26_01205 [Rhodospirillales bacterium]
MRPPVKAPSVFLNVQGLPAPILLDGCASLEGEIRALLKGWPVERLEGAEGAAPGITIKKNKQGYLRLSDWSDASVVFAHPVDAVCDFLVDLVRAYIRDNPPLLCLHCAAVETQAGLVVFPSSYAAGKSTLAMHMAAAGARLFADDVMPLRKEDGHGVAPGILPRLRLPLPAETSRVLGSFLKQRPGKSSQRFAYYAMREDELAAHGEAAPVAGLVLLDRKNAGLAGLREVGMAEMLKSTILRNFSHSVPGIEVLDRLNALVAGARRLRLTYSSAEQAVECLRNAFPFKDKARK